MSEQKPMSVNGCADVQSSLNVELERLRVAAGIELEDSCEAGSKWQVGDEELAEIVRLAKAAEREACELRCAKTLVLLDGHHGYTALKVQQMMMDAISLRSNCIVTGAEPVGGASG